MIIKQLRHGQLSRMMLFLSSYGELNSPHLSH